MNAFTTKEYTTFYIRVLAEHVELGLDILCDILCRPALRPDEVDAERQVILEEILMHATSPVTSSRSTSPTPCSRTTLWGARSSATRR